LHARGHVEQDYSIPFNDAAMRKSLEDEVAKHDTKAEAYRLTAPNAPACADACKGHLYKVFEKLFQPIVQQMQQRAIARDARAGGG